MKRQGMSASDLARQVWGSTTDKRGYSVARNRDRVSHYLAGTSFPEPQNLEAIARILDVPPEELAAHAPAGRPSMTAALAEGVTMGPRFPRPTPNTLNMATVAGRPGMIRLQVDQVIPWKVAGEIYERLNELMALAVEADAIYPYMRASAVKARDEALRAADDAENVKRDRSQQPGDVIEGGRNGTEDG